MVRAVTNDYVQSCLDMETTVNLLETAYRAAAAGRAVNIPRSDMILPLGADEAYTFKLMPGMIEDMSVAAVRLQSDRIRWTDNRKRKLGAARDGQYVQHVLVYDTKTCEPILLMPDGFASKMRVGATNSLGAARLSPPDVRTVGLLGAGRQAGGQAWGFDAVFDLDQIRVYSPTRSNREAFADEWDDRLDARVEPVPSAREAVAGTDVLACATNAMRPVFEVDWIKPGTHVSAIKNPEVPDEAFRAVDRVAVHTRLHPNGPNNYAPRGSSFDHRLDEQWRIAGLDVDTVPHLASLIADPPDRDADDTTLFLNNMGLGIQFAAIGRYVFERAAEAGVGETIDISSFLQPMW